MLHVAFVNENTLGHGSYLPLYVRAFETDPGHGVVPRVVHATPLPPDLRRFGEGSVRLLRRWGLDLGPTRWRLAASRHVRHQLEELHARELLDAVVVNTQSVGLDLPRWPGCPPVVVCLDATFAQLARSPWFAPGVVGRLAAPLALAYLRRRERELVWAAAGFLPWSGAVGRSLVEEYGVPADRVVILPPSVDPPEAAADLPREGPGRPRRVLFVGGDFARKGGRVLLEAYRRHLRDGFELHLVTASDVTPEPGVFVYRGVRAHTPEWVERWRSADVFVFPSALETFGIVLLEALSFGVPVVSSRAGAAAELLGEGSAGVLVDRLTPTGLAAAIHGVFADRAATAARVRRGLDRIATRYTVQANARRLANVLHSAVGRGAGYAS
ncbi:MAG: glycosyltransferase family 4 protein [Planctomycetaceae bacterium]|nr:glycosyltransferase family 4 protein [Planctomycetaceae bacterium]MBV8313808.1 glycosyltransferase family 4 protein [Planctomycetaceae bacterium]MBV8608267.1 glycosyltransferase family 4 protein [Singulisphaera sp.]